MDAVRLEAPDPAWTARFASERKRLEGILGALVAAIEHIGSTAVPGLVAKPTIDVLAGVRDAAALDASVAPLRAAGYEYVPEWEVELPDRRYLRSGAAPMYDAHLHVVVLGSPFWERQVRFRDLLRAEPDVARAYAAVKARSAADSDGVRERYTEAKGPFIRAILRAPDAAARAAIARAELG
jgi:GrpB-like predicted nucleotidyltransferase (UPF0157 family)